MHKILASDTKKKTTFPVSGAGVGEIEVIIQDPSGRKGTVEQQLEDKGNSTYRCTYKPTLEGTYTIYITFGGMPIPRSPYTVTVGQGKWPVPCQACQWGFFVLGISAWGFLFKARSGVDAFSCANLCPLLSACYLLSWPALLSSILLLSEEPSPWISAAISAATRLDSGPMVLLSVGLGVGDRKRIAGWLATGRG